MISPNLSATAFTGGRILSMDPFVGEPEVLIVEHGRVAAAGERGILARFPGVTLHELGGRTLVPGFIDAHNHLSIAALHPLWADLSTAQTYDDIARLLREQAEREPEACWIRGFGWNEADHGLVLDRSHLDGFGFDRPVVVTHYTLHQCVVSSLGLDELNLGKSSRDPAGGRIERRPDGEPTGVLVERAWGDAHRVSLHAYRDPDRFADLFVARARALLRDGITCVHDAACAPSGEEIYRRLAAERRLPLSVVAMPHPEAILHAPDPARLDGPRTGEGDEWLRTGAVKLFADGGAEPAIDVCMAGNPITLGITFPDLATSAREAVARGFAVAVHAIGNLGLRNTLDALRDAARLRRDRDLRFRVEHALLASRAQLGEMAALEIVGVIQPGFVHHVGAQVHSVAFDDHEWLPFGDMARAGVKIAASSDDPCAFYQPILTAARGVTRRCASGEIVGPEQALGYEEWLRAYTAGAAYAGGQENERGTLTPGKRADLVILDGELDPANPPRVAETWVLGERVY